MTVFVIRDGQLVELAGLAEAAVDRRSIFPSPRVSRMTPFESPVTGKEITSWRERDRDMAAAGAVDPRDLPPPTKGRAQKEANHGRRRKPDSTFEWRDPD